MTPDDLAAAERTYYRRAQQLGADEPTAQRALERAVWDIADGRTSHPDPYEVALTKLQNHNHNGM